MYRSWVGVVVVALFAGPGPADDTRHEGKTAKEWAALWGDPAPKVRGQAAKALGAIGPESVATVPRLTELLQDSDADVRHWSAYALSCIGPEAKAAIPALCKVLKDGDE